MNQIIKNYLKEHIEEYGLSEYKEEVAFEHFINRCIVSRYSSERFNPDEIMTEEGEIGLDGVAVLLNQQIVTSVSEVKDIFNISKEVRVDFVFIQAKTSEKFDGGEMSTFTKGVRHFFQDEEDRPKTNDKLENLAKLKDYIYKITTNQEHRPYLSLYYVCCGKWVDGGNNLTDTVNLDKKTFEDTDDFEEVNYYTFDQDSIRNLYKEMRRKIQKTFVMEKHMAFPQMPGIKVAYFGLIRCKDLVGILKDESGNVLPNVFEDNVRDFQGYNPVNTEIRNTIRDDSAQQLFSILNNGITIVAGNVELNGDEITIFDYQVVNGCQTSRVLCDNYKYLHDNSYVSAKIIKVSDDKVLDSIVFTTNRQTEVKYEAFESSKPFHKKLEEYYNSVDPKFRLYYERRSKQYDTDEKIHKNKIISLGIQTRAYVAMFLKEPQSVHRYYGELLRSYKSRLYGENDSTEAYYISAYCFYLVDQKIKLGVIEKRYSPYKFHLCFIIRGIIGDIKLYQGNDRKLKNQALRLISKSQDDKEFAGYLRIACTILNDSLNEFETEENEHSHEYDVVGNTPDRNRRFTEIISDHILTYTKDSLNRHYLRKGDIVMCMVKAISIYNVDVALREDDEREKGSIHISEIADEYIHDINDYFRIGDYIQAEIISDEYKSSGYGWSLSTKRTGIRR